MYLERERERETVQKIEEQKKDKKRCIQLLLVGQLRAEAPTQNREGEKLKQKNKEKRLL